MDHAIQKTPEREAFYRKIDGENLSALWTVMGDLITPQPRVRADLICGASI